MQMLNAKVRAYKKTREQEKAAVLAEQRKARTLSYGSVRNEQRFVYRGVEYTKQSWGAVFKGSDGFEAVKLFLDHCLVEVLP